MFLILMFCSGLACKKKQISMLPNTPTEQLEWFRANPSSTAVVDIYVHTKWVSLGSERGPRVRLDDGALGVSLAQHIGDCQNPCAVTAELRWGALLPMPQELVAPEEPPTLSVVAINNIRRQ